MAEAISPPKMITSRRDAISGECQKKQKQRKTPACHAERDEVDENNRQISEHYHRSQRRAKKGEHGAIDNQGGHAGEARPNKNHSTQSRIVVFIWASTNARHEAR
jgi:hypothetical protein